ncbi:MAG: PfkB family carbohydrate kinase, partial [Pseudomonadota bacterium]
MTGRGRFVFAGAAHLDRVGRFSINAPRGLSTPGRLAIFPGGAALNTARTLAGLGFPCVLHTVGDADVSAPLVQTARAESIELYLQPTGGEASPSYTALLQPDGTLVAALADMAAYDFFDSEAVQRTNKEWLCVDANLSARSLAELLTDIRRGSAASDVRTIGLAVSSAKAARFQDYLSALDLLFCNRAEACVLASVPKQTEWDLIVDRLVAGGVNAAVISDGADPICVLEDGEASWIEPRAVAKPVSVVGAGDALAGGTLAALRLGAPLTTSVGFGTVLAALALQSDLAVDPDGIRAQSDVLQAIEEQIA